MNKITVKQKAIQSNMLPENKKEVIQYIEEYCPEKEENNENN